MKGVKSPGLEENFSSGLPCKSRLSKELLSPQSCVPTCSVVTDSVALWTVARQALLSRGYLRQEYWSGLPSPSPGGLADPGIEPASLASPALAGRGFTTVPPGKPPHNPVVNKLSCGLKRFLFYGIGIIVSVLIS